MKITPEEYLIALTHAAVAGGTMVHELPDVPVGQPFASEWNSFKRTAATLVDDGHAGRYALFKGDQPPSVWDTLRDAYQAGKKLFAGEPFLVQEIQLFVMPDRWGSSIPTQVTDPENCTKSWRSNRPRAKIVRAPRDLSRLETGQTTHWTQLAPARPGSALAAEWETYRREVGRLLAEGNEGKFARSRSR